MGEDQVIIRYGPFKGLVADFVTPCNERGWPEVVIQLFNVTKTLEVRSDQVRAYRVGLGLDAVH